MLRVLAIDDEPLALRQLVAYIQKIPFLELVAACHSAVQASKVISEETVDAMFCDINMPDLNGLDFIRQLSPAPLVVFTTAYSEYAIEGFRVDAVDYLLKPFSFSEFLTSAERLQQRHELIQAAAQSDASSSQTREYDSSVLYVRADHRTINMKVSEIIHVQAMGEYLRIFLTSQPRAIMTLMAMKRMEEALQDKGFMRIHRSHIINLSHISHIVKGRVRLADGTELPIGDNYRPAFEQWLAEHRL